MHVSEARIRGDLNEPQALVVPADALSQIISPRIKKQFPYHVDVTG